MSQLHSIARASYCVYSFRFRHHDCTSCTEFVKNNICRKCVMCVQSVFFGLLSFFCVCACTTTIYCCAAGSYMTSFLIIALFDRLNSDRCEIIVWGRQNNNKISTFFCVGRRMEIYRFIVWKNHVCPSGSLRVKYENKEKGKKKESDAVREREVVRRVMVRQRGRGEREREREQNRRSTLVSIFSSKNNRNECIWYGTEHEIRILYIILFRRNSSIGLQLRSLYRRKK